MGNFGKEELKGHFLNTTPQSCQSRGVNTGFTLSRIVDNFN